MSEMINKVFSGQSKYNIANEGYFSIEESRIRNDRQAIFSIVRDLAFAQFELSDIELTNRLWQDLLDRKIDIDRVTHLLYGCYFFDDNELIEADLAFEKKLIVKD